MPCESEICVKVKETVSMLHDTFILFLIMSQYSD